MYIPFFPLKLVAFPDEALNLHIFEPRYRELFADIENATETFGVVTYIDKISGFGTLMRLDQVYKRYEDGRMDIKTIGLQPFRILSFDNPSPGKTYSGGEVEFLVNEPEVERFLHQEFIFYLREMLYLLKFEPDFNPNETNSFSFAHKVGLSLEEELELLKMTSENDRTRFMINHFKRMIPVLKAAELARLKISQNGHFKHLDPLDF